MRLLDAMLEATGGQGVDNVAEWCRVNEVTTRTYFRHRARVLAEGSWQPRSRRPRDSPAATPEQVARLVCQLREQLAPDNGADSIRAELEVRAEREGWTSQQLVVPSRATINRLLDRAGLLDKNPAKRPRASYRRFVYARPRDCYQIDATFHRLAAGATAVSFDVIDDASRVWAAAHVAPSETIDAAIAAMAAAVAEWGAPALVLTDNGTAFAHPRRWQDKTLTSAFGLVLTQRWGSLVIHSSPYHPQTLGKNERLHQTAKKLLAHRWPEPPADLAELAARLEIVREHYNQQRRHSAIARPASRTDTGTPIRTPAQAWTYLGARVGYGNPTDLPRQLDATVHRRRVATNGLVTLAAAHGAHPATVSVGRHLAGTTITVLRNGEHITVYTPNGDVLGRRSIDPTKRYQGQLTPTAA